LWNFDEAVIVSFNGRSSMNPMSRFAVFAVCLVALVAVASQPRLGAKVSKSMNDLCVCVPARAGLIAKTAIAKTRVKSAQLFASKAPSGR
jgi:hypothetical protein